MMAERVVDVLEPIDIEIGERYDAARVQLLVDGARSHFGEEESIGQTRKSIVSRLVARVCLAIGELGRCAPKPSQRHRSEESEDQQAGDDERQDDRQEDSPRLPRRPTDHTGLQAVVGDERLGKRSVDSSRALRQLEVRNQKRARKIGDEVVIDVDNADEEIRRPGSEAHVGVRSDRDHRNEGRLAAKVEDVPAPFGEIQDLGELIVGVLRGSEEIVSVTEPDGCPRISRMTGASWRIRASASKSAASALPIE